MAIRTVISVDPRKLRRIGTMDYKEALPLCDHEVVLPFDDGPSATYTPPQVLDALGAECVKAIHGLQPQTVVSA